MRKKIFDLNSEFSYKKINSELKNFLKIYKKRPIKNNKGGCRINHAFAIYFILKRLKPKLVIESGIYKGQTTWLIEKTLPKTKLICIDIDLSQRKYISKKAKYSDIDFKFHDFSKIPLNTLVFFDDHVNHLERIKEASFFKIKNIILEDNYNNKGGDFQTIKQLFENHKFTHNESFFSYIKTLFLFSKVIIKKIISNKYNAYNDLNKIQNRIRDFSFYKNHLNNIKNNINFYFEFPPLVKINMTTKKPILKKISVKFGELFKELKFYNYITFIRLK
tara:strand:+ start:363 stop:1190 length:828 start_codon:yes stop_codon:yes gene_type:complete